MWSLDLGGTRPTHRGHERVGGRFGNGWGEMPSITKPIRRRCA